MLQLTVKLRELPASLIVYLLMKGILIADRINQLDIKPSELKTRRRTKSSNRKCLNVLEVWPSMHDEYYEVQTATSNAES
jgi:hypothetical protein